MAVVVHAEGDAASLHIHAAERAVALPGSGTKHRSHLDGVGRWNRELDAEVPRPIGSGTEEFNAVISCVGFLSRPQMPEIECMDSFGGAAFHTTAWPEDVDVKGPYRKSQPRYLLNR